MKLKTFGLLSLSILILVVFMGAVSAALTLEAVSVPTSIVEGTTTVNVTFNLSATTSDYTSLNWSNSTSNIGSWTTLPTLASISAGTTESLSAVLTIPSTPSQSINASIIVFEGADEDSLPITISIVPQDVVTCNNVGNPGELEIKKIDFTNNGIQYAGFGEDDDNWFPFEDIEVEIEVENDGDYDVDDISVEWGIYSVEDDDWLIDLDEEDEVNIKDGDQETFLIDFKLDDDLDIDLEDFVDNTDNYRFYVIATGTIDDSDSPDDGEDTCAFDYEAASILIEDFVILDNIKMPETLECGETATITADVWNIGDRDQDEVSVEISGRENALDFSETFEVGDIDKFDKQQLSFTFTVPKNIDEKFYALVFEINDEDGDVFENSDDDPSEFVVPFEVEGGCSAVEIPALVSASLTSGGKAGEELVVTATITNMEDERIVYSLNAAGFAEWASSADLDQTTIILDAGESEDVLITLNVKDDVSGEKTFNIEVLSENELVVTQPVSVLIEDSGLFGGFLTGLISEGNWYLWGIGALNLVLIVVIILVALRVIRR